MSEQIKTIRMSQAKAALDEAARRYPDAHGALTFLWIASGLAERKPTKAELKKWERIARERGLI